MSRWHNAGDLQMMNEADRSAEIVGDGLAKSIQAQALLLRKEKTDAERKIVGHVHPWEAAGLGKAPFVVVGYREEVYQACQGAPIQPGTSCDYCGQGIRYVVDIQAACGACFKVGCDCAEKTHKKGTPVYTKAKRYRLDMQAKRRKERAKVRIQAAQEALETAEIRKALSESPHPNKRRADKGDTLLDWSLWMMRHAGTKGRLDVARCVEKIAKEK